MNNLFFLCALACVGIGAHGFVARTSLLSCTKSCKSIARYAADKDDQTIKDLNLEQMFEVFETADQTVSSSAIPKGLVGSKFDAKATVGSSLPLGFFDPAGYTKDVSEEQYKMYQEAEIKHGRVSMLAFVGLVVGELFPGIFFNGQITGPAIYQFQQADAILPFFWLLVLGLVGAIEVKSIATAWQPLGDTLKEPFSLAKLRSSYQPGNLGFDPLGLTPKSKEEFKVIRTKELNNGRLAMLGVAGIVAQELVTGQSIF